MKVIPLPCIAFLLMAGFTPAQSAETAPPAGQTGFQTSPDSNARTYYREHRLRAYERSRARMSQGATCVTKTLVCWIENPVLNGDACSCETPSGKLRHGVVGG